MALTSQIKIKEKYFVRYEHQNFQCLFLQLCAAQLRDLNVYIKYVIIPKFKPILLQYM